MCNAYSIYLESAQTNYKTACTVVLQVVFQTGADTC